MLAVLLGILHISFVGLQNNQTSFKLSNFFLQHFTKKK